MQTGFKKLQCELVKCSLCPRLKEWREEVGRTKVKRHENESYWSKPVPAFGPADAELILVGLAPGAQGSNRTGRMFTGDDSGKFLFQSLYNTGFCSAPSATSADDGLQLKNCLITAAVRCVPPQNKPTTKEIATCRNAWLTDEFRLLKKARAFLGLGKIGFDAAHDTLIASGIVEEEPRPKFSHGTVHRYQNGMHLAGTYHPSRQNTNTGRLTLQMLDDIFLLCKKLIKA